VALPSVSHTVLRPDPPHYSWNNALAPRLEVRPGETVTFETRDAGDGHFGPTTTAADILTHTFRGHPLTGPVFVQGAQPGDTLQVDVLEVTPADYGWTAVIPGLGLLQDDFHEPHLRIWDLHDRQSARLDDLARIPLDPFCGVMGVALAEPGEHTTMPPRRVGGNMDIKQLVAGSTLYLPVEVEGALFSVGDAHAAQGDGEVCVTAIEMGSTTTLRFDVRKDLHPPEPQFRTPGVRARGSAGSSYVTTAAHPDLMVASQQALRYMLDHLEADYKLSRPDAYVLASVAVDLKISEIVDAPNWIVSAFLPLDIFTT
jgi:acetamidase/formamidase